MNLTNWPTGNSPSAGPCGRLIDNAIAQGVTDGDRYLIRRATNGVSLGLGTDANIFGLRDDVIALAKGPPDVICIWLGANDANNQTEYDAYIATTGLRRVLTLLRYEFPTSTLMLLGEETGDPTVTYALLDEIKTHKQQMASEFGWCRYVDMAGIDLVDDIHPPPTIVTISPRTTPRRCG